MRPLLLPLALAAMPGAASAETAVTSAADFEHYDVTVRRLAPARGEAFVPPVDSANEERAIIADAASWPGKVAGGRPLAVAFVAARIARR